TACIRPAPEEHEERAADDEERMTASEVDRPEDDAAQEGARVRAPFREPFGPSVASGEPHPSTPAKRSAPSAAAPHIPAKTSSRTIPQPPRSRRSAQRAGNGLTWSKRRKRTKPSTSPCHVAGASSHVTCTPATSSMTTI